GGDHPGTLNNPSLLALIYRKEGQGDTAEELQVQVMEISHKKLGMGNSHTLSSMVDLASIYQQQCR
ncbi:hypothetical protein BX600DRAFT_391345, partial [Xylariales sp. PMI_506]